MKDSDEHSLETHPNSIFDAWADVAMIERGQLLELLGGFEAHENGLPAELCRDVADLLVISDVTFAFVGGPSRGATLCASSPNALTLNNWQFTLDEGPCLEAAAAGRSISGSAMSGDTPWPLLAEKARELGYDTIAGIPLSVSGQPFGAMNLQAIPGEFGEETLEDAEEVADHLAGPVVGRLAEAAPTLPDLGDYATVHEATGMISAQMEIGIQDALAVLRAHAWTRGRPLIRIAQEVVGRELVFKPPESRDGE